MKTVTRCPKNRDEIAHSSNKFVTVFVTSLFYHTPTARSSKRSSSHADR